MKSQMKIRNDMSDDFKYELNGHKYSEEQMIELYAKLKMAQFMVERGTALAKEVETNIKFYRMVNEIED